MKCKYTKTAEAMNLYYRLYNEAILRGYEAGIIIRISEHFNIAPCLIAKLILKKYLENISEDKSEVDIVQVKAFLRDTSRIEDSILAYEVFLVGALLYINTG